MRKILAGFILGLASLVAQAALVEIVPSNQTVNVGDDVIVSIVGSGFTDLIGGGVDLSFTPGVLELGAPTNVNITLANPPWDGGFNRTEEVDDSIGILRNFSFNQMNGVSDPIFPIARLTFRAIAPGVSNLTIFASARFPFYDGRVMVPNFGETVQVVVVPEPATWGLFAAGLGLMILLGRRRSAA